MAQLLGINTNRIYFSAYVNVSFLSALAALVVAARFTSANPAAGTNYELDAIGSCFIGGASAYGGIGKVSGVVVGAVIVHGSRVAASYAVNSVAFAAKFAPVQDAAGATLPA